MMNLSISNKDMPNTGWPGWAVWWERPPFLNRPKVVLFNDVMGVNLTNPSISNLWYYDYSKYAGGEEHLRMDLEQNAPHTGGFYENLFLDLHVSPMRYFEFQQVNFSGWK